MLTMHSKFNKMVTFQDSNSKMAKTYDFNSNGAKIADLQAQKVTIVLNFKCTVNITTLDTKRQ